MTTADLVRATTSAVAPDANTTMKALVYHGPGKRAWEEKPHPTIQDPGDAVVRITTSTICGTDLHILKGDLPAVTDGRILGHEGIGVVEHVGTGVSAFHVGDRVIISCITACLKCDFCKRLNTPTVGTAVSGHCRGRRTPCECGRPRQTDLEHLWDRNIAITTRLVNTVTTPMLLRLVRSAQLQPGKLVTHRFDARHHGSLRYVWKRGQRGRPQGDSDERRASLTDRGDDSRCDRRLNTASLPGPGSS